MLDKALSYPLALINVANTSERELHLQERFSLRPPAMEDVMHHEQRLKVDDYADNQVTILHALKYVEGEIKMEELFLGDQPIAEGFIKTLKAMTPHPAIQSADLYHILIVKVIDGYLAVLDDVEERIDRLQEREEPPRRSVA